MKTDRQNKSAKNMVHNRAQYPILSTDTFNYSEIQKYFYLAYLAREADISHYHMPKQLKIRSNKHPS
ncbi:hypothetical protein EUGRSUZ_B02073 [Eucalyptus grandis]|uniref:Uncharacterized protein n=2 Tax=Eucalyptus grandis TaxID=71139 RepID=A0ACC3M194_EUCGR|nr:hypothetical protein EUGRSUZ_B02073 [Eucalyptus grandis]